MANRLREHNESTILRAAHDGATLVEICDLLGVTPYYLTKYEDEHPTFAGALDRALVKGSRYRLARLVAEIDNYLRDGGGVGTAKGRLDLLKFYLEKQFPAVYSPKQQLEVTHTVDLRGLIEAAKSRQQIIDITPIATPSDERNAIDVVSISAAPVADNSKAGDRVAGG